MRKIRESITGYIRGLGILSLMLVLTLLVSCDRLMAGRFQHLTTQSENSTHEPLPENFANLLGKTISVRGQTQERVGGFAFLLNANQQLAEEKILIINVSGEDFFLPVENSIDVKVTGAARKFIRTDLEQEFDLSLDPELFSEYDQHPVIAAQTIILAPKSKDIAAHPEQYYNQRIAVEGKIGKVLGRHAFTINDESLVPNRGLLVVNPANKVSYQVDDAVGVTGILRAFVAAELNQKYDLAWTPETLKEIETEYKNRPALLADKVTRTELSQGQKA